MRLSREERALNEKSSLSALILAAGNGKRMKSTHPKALCEILFKPMICWVRDWCLRAGITDICVVIGPEGDAIRAHFPENTSFAVQTDRRGTGHAVMQAEDFLRAHAGGDVLVLAGDAPFVDDETLRGALHSHREENRSVTVITAEVDDPTGYGRIVRGKDGVEAIVEEADANAEVRAIREVNSGSFWFDVDFLLNTLSHLGCNNAQGEYYLTDTVHEASRIGARVGAFRSSNADVALGANDRRGLLRLSEIARMHVLERLMDEGVHILCADGVMISPDARIGRDTQIYPNVIVRGHTRIGEGCTLTSGTVITDSVIGSGAVINASQITSSTVDDGASIGPFSQLRPNSHIGPRVKIGDFVEIKNSTLGEKTSVAHLTYIGDSDVGERINIGGGVITCNYDGVHKHRTAIGDDAFIGCNTNLIAPVSVGNGAYIAAGSTITDDIPDDALAIARERQTVKPGRAVRYRKEKP